MNVFWTGLIVILFPFYAYLCIKLCTYAYYQSKKNFEQDQLFNQGESK